MLILIVFFRAQVYVEEYGIMELSGSIACSGEYTIVSRYEMQSSLAFCSPLFFLIDKKESMYMGCADPRYEMQSSLAFCSPLFS
jgi:hypothetical protein